MMNVIGVCLMVASLVGAGVWSPVQTTRKPVGDDDMIVKEGHRVVVVEYDQDGDPITKVSVSPDFHRYNSDDSSVSDKRGESDGGGGGSEWRSPKELICDAYGRCKHRIAGAVGKTKDSIAHMAQRVEEAVEAEGEMARTAAHRVEEAVSGVAHQAAEKTRSAAHGVEEAAHGAAEKMRSAAHRARETTAHDAENAYGRAKETARQGADIVEDDAREVVKDVRDLGKTIGTDVAKNVTGFAHDALTSALFERVLSPESLNPISGTLYVLAFATAYGTCVWVTFVEGCVLAAALPKSQFAVVQSKLFPVYFRTTVVSVGTAIFWFIMVHRGKIFSSLPEIMQLYNLFASLIFVLINSFFLERRATKVMFERMRVEKEEGRGRKESSQEPQTPEPSRTTGEGGAEQETIRNRIAELNGRLKKLNTASSVLNMMCLMCLSWHVFYLGVRLHLTF